MVLLGFIDEPKGGKTGGGDDDDPSNWTISRIGGQPAFPSDEIAKQLKSRLVCERCQQEQIFVSQLYCPLEGHKYDRAVYLFACRNPSCWNTSNSWTAIRCQKYDETVEESISIDSEPLATVPSSSSADWCDDANAWNSDEDNDTPMNQPSSISLTVKKEKKQEPEVMLNSMKIEDDDVKSSTDEDDEVDTETKKKSNNKPVSVASSDAFNEWKKNNLNKQEVDTSKNASFPFYYIVIDDEDIIVDEAKLSEDKKLKKKMKKLGNIDEDEDEDETTKGGKEKYEKTPDIEHGDVVFYKFQQKIRYAPDQIIRYDWSGNPLILTKFDATTLSTTQKCRHCQSSCVFEFQLMPALVNFLKIDNQIGLEFGTVFVYTCSANCWKDNDDLYRFENVFVQADPDQNLFD